MVQSLRQSRRLNSYLTHEVNRLYSEIKNTLKKALPRIDFSYPKEMMLCSLSVFFYTTKLQNYHKLSPFSLVYTNHSTSGLGPLCSKIGFELTELLPTATFFERVV
jgi:hypothetical protein